MIQAVLFQKSKYTPKKCREWIKAHNYHSISNRTTNEYYRYRLIEPNYNKYIYRIKHNINGPDFIIQYTK